MLSILTYYVNFAVSVLKRFTDGFLMILYHSILHRPLPRHPFPQTVRQPPRKKIGVRRAARTLAPEVRQKPPRGGRDTHDRQIQRSEQQRLNGMSVFMHQQALLHLKIGNPALFALVPRGLCGHKQKHPKGRAERKCAFRHHRAVIAIMPTFFDIPQKHRQPQQRLRQSPCALEQNVENTSDCFHAIVTFQTFSSNRSSYPLGHRAFRSRPLSANTARSLV